MFRVNNQDIPLLPEKVDVERVNAGFVIKKRSINQTLTVDIFNFTNKYNYLLIYPNVEKSDLSWWEDYNFTSQVCFCNDASLTFSGTFFISTEKYSQVGNVMSGIIIKLEQI